MTTCRYADQFGRALLMIGRGAGTRAGWVVLLLMSPATALAQEGVPGSRLPSGRDHRAALRAEAYKSVARFFAEWREAWNGGDAMALARLYTEDATVRLPGQALMRGKAPVETTVRAAVAGAGSLSMSDVDFDSDGERSILVSRYILRREGHVVEGVMTAVMHRHRSSWRLRVQVFDAPENAAPQGAASAPTPLLFGSANRDARAGSTPAQPQWPTPLRRRGTTRLEFERPPAGTSGRDQRAAVRAEAYRSAARFFAEWREAWNGRDAPSLARLYTEDATLRLPGQGIMQGKRAFETAAQRAAGSRGKLSMTDVDFDGNGEWAVLVARYVLSGEGQLAEGVMTALMFGHRSGWRIRAHIFDAPEKTSTI